MNDILSTISRGKRPRHIFALIYGVDGVGKSTVCSHAPNPIFVGAEKGTEQLDVARFPQTETIQELLDQLRALQTQKHGFDTVVLDSLDWIEPLIWKSVCDEAKVDSIEQAFGGYGKGYVRALDLWRVLLKELAILNRSMHVLMIGHAQIKSFQDPDLASAYDRYQLKINDKAAALVREAADAVLFARFETEVIRDGGNGRSKAKVRGEGVRVMYTESRPAFDAKNRFGLPFAMPLDWKMFGAAVRAFYGLKENGNGNRPASATVTESALSVPMNGKPESETLVKVRQLMDSAKISESEFIAILQVAQIPEALIASSLSDIPDKSFVLATENWASVIAMVDELRVQQEAA
jgi:AAA domain